MDGWLAGGLYNSLQNECISWTVLGISITFSSLKASTTDNIKELSVQGCRLVCPSPGLQ